MANTRTYHAFLEQSRRHWRSFGVAAALVLAAGVLVVLRPQAKASSVPAPAAPKPEQRIIVEVLNGTRKQGAARAATRMLRNQGLDVVFLGNADSLSPLTQVLVRRGDPNRAHYVLTALGAGRLRIDIDTLRRVDVSVILGDDFHPKLGLHP